MIHLHLSFMSFVKPDWLEEIVYACGFGDRIEARFFQHGWNAAAEIISGLFEYLEGWSLDASEEIHRRAKLETVRIHRCIRYPEFSLV